MEPDRIVIGSNSERALATMEKVYGPFMAPIMVTDVNSAELIKHAANSFLALKISYINALSSICEALGQISKRSQKGSEQTSESDAAFSMQALDTEGRAF